MSAISRAWRAGLVPAALLGLGACATAPTPYGYVRQSDSASLSGAAYAIADSGSAEVFLDAIDKDLVGDLGQGTTAEVFLSPGTHEIALNTQGPVGFYGASESFLVFGREFAANHAYQVTGSYAEGADVFSLALWDETGGPGGRTVVQTWAIHGQPAGEAAHDLMAYEDLIGEEFPSPPFDAGGASGFGGSPIPSIPTSPWPGGFGGGGHGGGSRGGRRDAKRG